MTFPCCPWEAPCSQHGGPDPFAGAEPERFYVTAAGVAPLGPEPAIDREAFLAAGRVPDPEAEAAEAAEAEADAEAGYWQDRADAGLFDPEAGQ